MTTIVEFLTARYAEEEAEARDAIAERKLIAERLNNPGWGTEPDFTFRMSPDLGTPAVVVGAERVLADIAAKRKILEECAYWYDRLNARVIPTPPDAPKLTPPTPLELEREAGKFEVAMPILLLLAAPFADHPLYDESWRP